MFLGICKRTIIGTYRDFLPLCSRTGIMYDGKFGAVLERIIANGGHTVRDGHRGQAVAVIERIIANGGHAVRDLIDTGQLSGSLYQRCFIFIKQNAFRIAAIVLIIWIHPYTSQVVAVTERLIANGGHAVTDGHRGQVAGRERTITNGGHAVTDGHRGQVAGRERRIANGGHAVRDGHRGQADAVTERSPANGGHAVTDGHRGQAGAVVERPLANGGHAVTDGHRGQAGAPIERIIANGCHAVTDDDFLNRIPIGIPRC